MTGLWQEVVDSFAFTLHMIAGTVGVAAGVACVVIAIYAVALAVFWIVDRP